MVAVGQQETALLYAAGYEVVYGRGAVGLAEGVDEVVFVDVCELCKLVEAYALLEVLIYVAADDAALAFVAVTGGLGGLAAAVCAEV